MDDASTYTPEGKSDPADEDLMARVKSGDDGALEQLVRRYEQPLFQYARRMLGNAADAEDVFQEAFLRVFLHRNRFWSGAPFRPWLYRIATNLCRDRLRYRARRREIQPEADDGFLDPIARAPAAGIAPDAAAEGEERGRRMREALGALSVKHRAVFLMAHQEGLTYAEIARVLRIPAGTVKSRMNKAVSQLMAALESID